MSPTNVWLAGSLWGSINFKVLFHDPVPSQTVRCQGYPQIINVPHNFYQQRGRRKSCSISAWSPISGSKHWRVMNLVTLGTSRCKLATCLSKGKYKISLITMDILLAVWIVLDVKYYIHLCLYYFSRTTRKQKCLYPKDVTYMKVIHECT